ncbi:hypothetical protein D3875_00065 [Deinococcus cavernae]|uniref:Uncharacterized protein n=1 Tax=Deinococcus cavernae TaxID=2320857 RepID=A0A418VJ63_9DEIO|nr:hypothetical protein D3875_00065 [Deinococcus cavernae]
MLTLNRRAAKRLGVRPLRLNDLPLGLVRAAGLDLASPALSQRMMTQVIREHLDVREPGLTARAMLGAVRELLRSGADLNELKQNSSARIAQLARLTLAYRDALQGRQLLDQVQVTQRATELVRPQLLSLSGYPRLLPDEQRFLNAACDEGSVLHLPWVDHPYFLENLDAAQYLESQGWMVKKIDVPVTALAGAFLGQAHGGGKLHILTSED